MPIPCLSRSRIAFLILATLLLPATRAFAQQLPNLAPGVLRIVESAPEERDTATGPAPLLELAAQAPDWQPNYAAGSETLLAIANQVTLRRTVWQLEFAYKPMRMITIGNQRIWYLVYRVTNPGRHLRPSPNPDSFGHDKYSVELVSKSVRFTPTFHLQSYEFDQQYRDQILPAAVERIHKIEIRDPKIRLYDSVSISSQPILPSTSTEDNSLWGVATWVGVDPRIDFFSVFVQGLSNAYEWDPEATGADKLTYKTLQINFWRPGDAVLEHQDEFRVGLPYIEDATERAELLAQYGIDEVQDHLWVFQP